MDLIDDVDAVLSNLRRDLDLVHQVLDVFHSVVGGGIQFMDAVGTAFLEGYAGFAFAAGLHVLGWMGAVDSLCENPCSSGLSHSSGTTEKVGMCQLSPDDRVLQGLGYVVLSDQGFKRVRTVLPG